MPNQSVLSKLKDICQVGDGAHTSITRQEAGVLYLSSKNFKPTGLDLTKVDFISESDYLKHFGKNKKALTSPKKNDVLFGIIGTLGIPYLYKADDKFGLSSSVAILRPNYDMCSEYLYQFMTTPFFQDAVNAIKSGSAQGFLSLEMIKNLPIIQHEPDIQKKIAGVLSAYDDLIYNNQRQMALLEEMAAEIYREWFVRLRFPGHEKVKVIRGVPEGWNIDKVESIGNVVTGKTPSTDNTRYFRGEFHFIKTPDMHNNMFIFDTDETLTKAGVDSQKSQTVPENSICVSCIGTGGIVSITTRTCQTNQQINTVVLREKFQLEWAFFTIRNLKETLQMFGSTGTTMTNLSKGKFSSLKLIKPDQELIKQFHLLVTPMFEQIANLMQQTKLLKKSRAAILPRLISGKLSVEHLDIQFPPSMLDETVPLST